MIAQIIDKQARIKLMSSGSEASKVLGPPLKKAEINGMLRRYYEYFFKKAVMGGRVHSRESIVLYAVSIFKVEPEQAERNLAIVEDELPSLVKHSLKTRAQSTCGDMIKKRPFSVIGEVCHEQN
jgi:hypothetical protein